MLIKNKYFFIAVFFVIIIAVQAASAKENAAFGKKNGAVKAERVPKERQFVYDTKEKRDPFVALVTKEGRIIEPPARKRKTDEIYLEGIIYDPKGGSYAVIDGEIWKAGDSIGAATIIRIEPQKIIFLKSDKEFEVELKKEE